MIERIKQLEAISRQLDPDSEARKSVRDKVVDYTESFLDRIETLKAFVDDDSKAKDLRRSPISDKPADIEDLVRLVETAVDDPGINPASGGHLGYIPGGGIYYSALGDYMAAITNRYAGGWLRIVHQGTKDRKMSSVWRLRPPPPFSHTA